MFDLTEVESRMTTLELVDFLNEIGEGPETIRHDNLMRKVRTYITDPAALIFEGSYTAKDGSTRPCLALKKREAVLIAGTYSYKVAAAVYDRMTDLEATALALHNKLRETEGKLTKVLDAFDTVKRFGIQMREHFIQGHADRMVDLTLKRNPKCDAWNLHRQYVLHGRRDNTPDTEDTRLADSLLLESYQNRALEAKANPSESFPVLANSFGQQSLLP